MTRSEPHACGASPTARERHDSERSCGRNVRIELASITGEGGARTQGRKHSTARTKTYARMTFVIIRRESQDDVAIVREVVSAAFNRGDDEEPVETRLLDELRTCSGWIPAMSLVAMSNQRLVGHAVCTRGFVKDLKCVGLGPIAVTPATQRTGVGHALMHTMLGVLDALDEPLVALLGSPAYYSRFGFVPTTTVGVDPPDSQWGDYFQVRTLNSFDPRTRGTFQYAEPFDRL